MIPNEKELRAARESLRVAANAYEDAARAFAAAASKAAVAWRTYAGLARNRVPGSSDDGLPELADAATRASERSAEALGWAEAMDV